VETCINKKKEEPTIATTQANKRPRPLNYPCHICGIMGDKLMKYLRFGEMQNMFKDKGGQTIKSKPVAEVKVVIILINMVDVNVTAWSKPSEY
jgi:hypothetical protein